MRMPAIASTHGGELSRPAGDGRQSANALDASPEQDSGESARASSDQPCGRRSRANPPNPPGGRLPAGSLRCPPGLVEVPGGLLRTQKAGWSENSHGERFARPEVLVAQPSFCLGQTEVTRAALKESTRASEAALPAEVDFKAAEAHCKAHGLRLPTQNEWRFAAVAATDFLFPWGDEIPADGVCWLRGPSSAPCAVGTSLHDLTPDGVRDLGGNVVEWVYVPAHGAADGWIPYDAMGAAHDSNCLNLEVSDFLFDRTTGGSNAPRKLAGFRCAANGRPHASSQPVR